MPSLWSVNQVVSLQWESASNRSYGIEISSNLITWTPLATDLVATGTQAAFSTNLPDVAGFFRVYRAP